MAGIKFFPEESDVPQYRAPAAVDLSSDDDRSVAADSWSIKSEYGSTLDDEQRHSDASEALLATHIRAASDYSSDKEELDAEITTSMLGFQSYWDAAYEVELENFREHGQAGEVWFGVDVMDTIVSWIKSLCIDISLGNMPNHLENLRLEPINHGSNDVFSWSVLDIGTGNGLLLHELAKLGFFDLTGIDFSEGSIDLARSLAERNEFVNIRFLVDDILETKLEKLFQVVIDKGTLDAVGLHPDGPIKRIMYWDSVSRLLTPGGILVITSCNNTKDELVQEMNMHNERQVSEELGRTSGPVFQYLDHVRSYPTFMFAGSAGSRVATVAFLRTSK